jgi:predicted HTH domain antitoxin
MLPLVRGWFCSPPSNHAAVWRDAMQLVINYPEHLADALQETPEELEQEMKTALAVKLFELKRISSGIAADLIGIDRVEFLMNLHRYGVSMIDISASELEGDMLNV